MLILAIHEAPSLTQERYAEVVRRLTGKNRIESPSDLPFDGLLVHAAGQGPNGFCVFDVSSQRRLWSAFDRRWGPSRRTSGSKNHRSSFQRTPRCPSPSRRRWAFIVTLRGHADL